MNFVASAKFGERLVRPWRKTKSLLSFPRKMELNTVIKTLKSQKPLKSKFSIKIYGKSNAKYINLSWGKKTFIIQVF